MIVLGVDPGFANFGFGVADMKTRTVLEAHVIRTEASAKKQNVFAADDTFRRTEEIARVLVRVISAHGVQALASESISYPRNASVSAKIAMSWGVLAALAVLVDLPMAFASPQQIKINVAGSKSASKQEIATKVYDFFGDDWAPVLPKDKYEHVCDALAAIIATENAPVMRALR